MKKLLFILPLMALLLWGCGDNIVGFYFVQPIVKIEADTTTLVRTIPEGESEDWQAWDEGVDSFMLSMEIKEDAGYTAYIEEVQIDLYDIEGNRVSVIGNKNYVPPITLEANKSDSLSNIWVYIDEGDAANIENADPNERNGFLVYRVYFSDDRGSSYSSMKFYRNISLRHPAK